MVTLLLTVVEWAGGTAEHLCVAGFKTVRTAWCRVMRAEPLRQGGMLLGASNKTIQYKRVM